MALFKEITNQKGVTSRYFRISNVALDIDSKNIVITLKEYASNTYRNKEKEISDLQNDRLDRILTLLSDYIPQLGNQKIVLDTGALVGEIVEPMDDALGERAEAKQRNRYS